MELVPTAAVSSTGQSRAAMGAWTKIGYALAVLAFLGCATLAVEGARTAARARGELANIIELLGALHETYSLLQDMETGQRGYIITRSTDYLEPYHQAEARLQPALERLRKRFARRFDDEAWMGNFERLVRDKKAELGRTIESIQRNQPDDAIARVMSGEGRRLMDEIRTAIDEREALELQAMRDMAEVAERAIQRAVIMGVGAAILGLGIVGVSIFRLRRELTARQAVADELYRQREELRVTLMSIGDGVITTDTAGRIVALNGQAEILTGWTNAEAVGKPLESVFQITDEATGQEVENPANRALREGRLVGLANHTALTARDGKRRAIDDSAAPIRDGDGAVLGAVLVFRDVTEQRAAQATLVESQRQKDEFLAMLGHELRNPLAGILTGVQVLKMLRPEGDAAQMQEVIERQAAHMSRMVDDLLDVSRFARGKLALRRDHLDLRELVRVCVEDYRSSQLVEDCQLEAMLPDAPVPVFGDQTRLAQALSNLIHNACKFCDGPNRVKVALEVDASTNLATITVSDCGIGMDEATLARLFQPFVQADTSLERSRGGLGLGLALVHGIVRLHEGTVTATSCGPGQGSQFRLQMPLAAPHDEAVESPEQPSAEPQRVLLIDDRRDALMPLEKLLRIAGHDVRTAMTGEDGLAAARQFHPTIVLCDIGLDDDLDGYDIARAMRSEPALASAYLVAVTGYGYEDDRQCAREAGFDYHVTKPVGKRDLEQIIGRKPRF